MRWMIVAMSQQYKQQFHEQQSKWIVQIGIEPKLAEPWPKYCYNSAFHGCDWRSSRAKLSFVLPGKNILPATRKCHRHHVKCLWDHAKYPMFGEFEPVPASGSNMESDLNKIRFEKFCQKHCSVLAPCRPGNGSTSCWCWSAWPRSTRRIWRRLFWETYYAAACSAWTQRQWPISAGGLVTLQVWSETKT